MVMSAFVAAGGALEACAEPILVANEDNDHFFKYPSDRMTREGLIDYIDKFAPGHFTHFFMCPSGQRPSYNTKAPNWEPIWAGLNEPNGEGQTNDIWAVNAKILFDKGIDPYKVWIQRCHERGISPWFSVRMNDLHFAWITNYFRNTTFFRTRYDLRMTDLREHPPKEKFSWGHFALNFAKEEVRDYTFGLIREQIANYDIDGYEMDFMRFCHYFPVGTERDNAPIMTAFVRRVRTFADETARKRGRPIKLSVRVPYCPQAARDKGLFAVEWAKEGLIDWIVATGGSLDCEIPLYAWDEELGDARARTVVLPCNDFQANSYPHAPFVQTTRELHYGWANAMYAAGAKGLYLFNIPYSQTNFVHFARTGLAPDFVARQNCRYRVGFHSDISEDGLLVDPEQTQLPKRIGYGDATLTLTVGPHPEATSAFVVVSFSEEAPTDHLRVTLNGVAPSRVEKVTDEQELGLYARGVAKLTLRCTVPVSAVREGVNVIQVKDTEARRLVWCEIEVNATEPGVRDQGR